MKANRLNLGVVLAEISNDFIDEELMEEAKKRSSGIESTVLAHYLILRSEFHSKFNEIHKKIYSTNFVIDNLFYSEVKHMDQSKTLSNPDVVIVGAGVAGYTCFTN